MSFKIIKTSKHSKARVGELKTAHGNIRTPFFMPIATRGSVKAVSAAELKQLSSEIILSNTYHLYLKPGSEVLKKSGGLHKFMDWPLAILTDSGGFQVFSLKDKNQSSGLVKVMEKGVEFKSVYDGSKHLFTPKKVLDIQSIIGSDIRMVLDVCSPAKCSRERAAKDLAITSKWAKMSQTAIVATHNRASLQKNSFPLFFAIVQGALYKDLRLKCAKELSKMNFSGYAIGGLAVGETPKEMYKVLDYTVPALPFDKPHYLMGVGYPEQIVEAVKRGIDMFDCVIPTREARHGRLYLFNSKINHQISKVQFKNQKFYRTISIRSAKFAKDNSPINPNSKLPELRNYSKAYLRHLFSVSEPLALRLATLNNVEFYLELMEKIRQAIKAGQL